MRYIGIPGVGEGISVLNWAYNSTKSVIDSFGPAMKSLFESLFMMCAEKMAIVQFGSIWKQDKLAIIIYLCGPLNHRACPIHPSSEHDEWVSRVLIQLKSPGWADFFNTSTLGLLDASTFYIKYNHLLEAKWCPSQSDRVVVG